jgi:hypothetical protein
MFIIIPKGVRVYPLISNLLLLLEDNNVAVVAFLIFAILCLYLLWATIKGNVKFGLRVLICWAVHPMK